MSPGKEDVHLGLLDDMDHEAKWDTDAEYRRTELRIQALGAAISRRDWYAVEQAHAVIRDKFYSHSTPAAPAVAGSEKVRAWNLVEALRAPEGHSVTLVCDNPDFNGQPNCAIEVCGNWTDWEQKRFTGETVLDALREAHAAMTAHEDAALYATEG